MTEELKPGAAVPSRFHYEEKIRSIVERLTESDLILLYVDLRCRYPNEARAEYLDLLKKQEDRMEYFKPARLGKDD